MAIDHLKVNNVFELGKDEGTDYIILPCYAPKCNDFSSIYRASKDVHANSWASEGTRLGCKPFQEKNFGIEIFCSSDSVFSADSEYGFQKF